MFLFVYLFISWLNLMKAALVSLHDVIEWKLGVSQAGEFNPLFGHLDWFRFLYLFIFPPFVER